MAVAGVVALACALGLAPTGHARVTPSSLGRLCAELLGRADQPPRPEDYDLRVPALPMAPQCKNACLYMATVSHLQNRLGERLSSEYLDLVRLNANAARVFAGETPWWLNLGTSPLSSEQGAMFWGVFKDIRQLGGLIPHDRYQAPHAHAERLSDSARMLADVFGEIPDTAIQMLNSKISADLLAFRYLEGQPEETKKVRARIDESLTEWLGGLDPTFDARAYTRKVTDGLDVIELVVQSPSHPFGQIPLDGVEKEVMRPLDQGRNVMLGFALPSWRSYDQSVLRLESDQREEEAKVRAAQHSHNGHAVTIEGYRRDWRGRPRWLLIRDWQNRGNEEPQYVHMHINFFRVYADVIAYLRKP